MQFILLLLWKWSFPYGPVTLKKKSFHSAGILVEMFFAHIALVTMILKHIINCFYVTKKLCALVESLALELWHTAPSVAAFLQESQW